MFSMTQTGVPSRRRMDTSRFEMGSLFPQARHDPIPVLFAVVERVGALAHEFFAVRDSRNIRAMASLPSRMRPSRVLR